MTPAPLYPPKLRPGDTVRVIAPSSSRVLVMEHDHSALIEKRFSGLGLTLTFGDHVDESDDFRSSPVASRVADLHAAFADPAVQGILTVIGGFLSNELLPHLDWDLIAAHPKVFCGYSDITALQNATLARTGLVTYHGPHWSSFGMRDHFDDTLRWFGQAVLSDEPFAIEPATGWTDDTGSPTRTTAPSSPARAGGPSAPVGRAGGWSAATSAPSTCCRARPLGRRSRGRSWSWKTTSSPTRPISPGCSPRCCSSPARPASGDWWSAASSGSAG